LEKVLDELKLDGGGTLERAKLVRESDLSALARECGVGGELVFFPRLRKELALHLEADCRVIRFLGVRNCVKQLSGARRWGVKCKAMQEQIVEYLRKCLSALAKGKEVALVVE